MTNARAYLLRLFDQVLFVFVTAFAANFSVDDFSTAKKAGLAGLAAALMLVKGVIGKFVGDPSTPNILPAVVNKIFGDPSKP